MGAVETIQNIDEVLGSSVMRYFSEGYKKVSYEIKDMQFDFNRKNLHTIVDIEYPGDWSLKKDEKKRVAHLGTVDVLVLGAQVCSAYVAKYMSLTTDDMEKVWVRKVEMRSGSKPLEDMGNVVISGRFLKCFESRDSMGGWISNFDIKVGTIRLKIELDHPGSGNSHSLYAGNSVFKINDILGDIENSYFGGLFKEYDRNIKSLHLHESKKSIRTTIDIKKKNSSDQAAGLSSAYIDAISMADIILTGAQLLQVLIYNYDRIDRKNSNNLWMRSVSATYLKPIYQMEEVAIEASLEDMELLNDDNENPWRLIKGLYRLTGHNDCFSIARAAHMLPE